MSIFDVSKLVSAGLDSARRKDRASEELSYASIFQGLATDLFGENTQRAAFYTVKAKDWYKTYPYRFVIRFSGSPTPGDYIYALPIPPSSYSVSTIMPSRATATLGGVVEESSEVVFFNIAMQGTFGQAISKQQGQTPAGKSDEFRRVFTSGGLLGSALSTVANTVTNVFNTPNRVNPLELLGSAQLPYLASYVNANTEASDGILKDTGKAIQTLLGPSKPADATNALTTTGGNGFTEVHAFQNFLLAYQKLASTRPGEWSLHFQNVKDNCEWRCILSSPPSFSKNAQRPFIYDYQISLTAWDLRPLDKVIPPIDRFGPGGDLSDITSATATGAYTKITKLLSAGLKADPVSLLKIRSIG